MTRRRTSTIALLLAAATALGLTAFASWLSDADGTAGAASAAGLVGNQPSAAASGDDVTVTWSASTFGDGTPASGYVVRRYSSPAGTEQVVLAGCSGTVTTTSCTENDVPVGAWQYTVTPSYLTWSGVEGSKSDVVTVIALDTTAPTLAVSFPAADGVYRTATWNAGSGTCTAICGTASDAASDVAGVAVSIRQGTGNYWTGVGSAFTSPVEVLHPATGTTSWSLAFPATNFPADGTYTVRVVATDMAANTASESRTLVYDATAPTNSLSITSLTGGSFLNGTTLYFKGNASGSFTFTNAMADAGSGPASSTFPADGASDWSHTAVTDTTPAGGPYTSNTFSWSSDPAGAPTGYAVTGADGAGNTTATAVTFTNDTSGPTGGSVSYADGYYTAASVAVTLANPTADTGSGVSSTGMQLQRQSATLSNGSCGSFGSFATIATEPALSYTDTTVTSGSCYRYRYLAFDRVGNQGTYTSSNTAKIDTANPTVAFTFPTAGGRYNASKWNAGCSTGSTGDFCGTASDVSGIASVQATVQRSSDSLYWNGSVWVATATSLSATGTTSWTRALGTGALTNGVTYTLTVTATDNNEQTATATRTFTYDTTAPTAFDIQTTGGGAANRIDSGDVIILTFSEEMDPASIKSGWDGSATSINNFVGLDNNSSNDRITFGNSYELGTIDLRSTAWVTSDTDLNATVSMATVDGRSVVTVTITESASGSTAAVTSALDLRWTPDADADDLAGNAASTTQVTESGTSDNDF